MTIRQTLLVDFIADLLGGSAEQMECRNGFSENKPDDQAKKDG
jgi:hypothetical protein